MQTACNFVCTALGIETCSDKLYVQSGPIRCTHFHLRSSATDYHSCTVVAIFDFRCVGVSEITQQVCTRTCRYSYRPIGRPTENCKSAYVYFTTANSASVLHGITCWPNRPVQALLRLLCYVVLVNGWAKCQHDKSTSLTNTIWWQSDWAWQHSLTLQALTFDHVTNIEF